MGFAIANVFDPLTERQLSVIGEFQRVLLVLLFLSINGHHFILHAIYRSCEVLPLGKIFLDPVAALEVLKLGGRVFSIAVQLASPAIIVAAPYHSGEVKRIEVAASAIICDAADVRDAAELDAALEMYSKKDAVLIDAPCLISRRRPEVVD